MASLEDRRQQLSARRKALVDRLRAIEGELDAHDTRDWEDMAIEHEADEVLEGMGEAGVREIRMIDAALKRIDEGSDGRCARCGEPIGEARLDLLPYTPFCRHCAR
jgi:RNA polymerase-binding transcription factor DksA